MRVHARLTDGTVVVLYKDCKCRNHTGPHWLAMDRSHHAINSAMAARGDLLSLMGAITEERVRLFNKRMEFEKRRIDRVLSPEEVAALPDAIRKSTGMRAHIKEYFHLSLDSAERHLSGNTLRAFTEVWTWSAYRMSSPAEDRQHRFAKQHGHDALKARINKTRAAFGWSPIP